MILPFSLIRWMLNSRASVQIYRPNAEQEVLDRPAELGDAEVLPGLSVDLSRVWA